MARPSGFDRAAAVEKAMQEIWRHGYAATSVNAMSAALVISRSSYYNAFGSREGLFRLALETYVARSPDQVLQHDPPDGCVRMALTRLYRKICQVRVADDEGRGCMIINSLCELGGVHGELGPRLSEAFAQNTARLERWLVLGVDRGELPRDLDTRTTAIALQTLMVGINTLSKALRDEDELWRTARMTLEGLDLYQEAEDAHV